MEKIKTVFVIDRTTNTAADTVQIEWVIQGEGEATIKFDGTSCAIIGGILYRRYDAKKGRVPPVGSIPCEPHADPITGHWPHWVKVENDDPSCKHHNEAFSADLEDGTYELVGPKIQKNKYGLDRHELWRHGSVVVQVERTREALLEWLTMNHQEGLVFHHPDGRMAKIRKKDFGLAW